MGMGTHAGGLLEGCCGGVDQLRACDEEVSSGPDEAAVLDETKRDETRRGADSSPAMRISSATTSEDTPPREAREGCCSSRRSSQQHSPNSRQAAKYT
jgi:hypothetical protein